MSIDYDLINKNIDSILSHFENQHELFPRNIMTSKTRGQVKIEYESDVQKSKDKIFEYFKESDFIDCKINAFPYNIEHTAVDLEVKNRTASSFIMIDLDLKDFENDKEKLDKQLKKTLNKLSEKLNDTSHPTLLWTGNGYHIYQPLEGIVFEKEKIFYDFLPYLDGKDLTTVFLRFAEKCFSNGKADPFHRPSIKSCLPRVPGTLNSKNNQEVTIIQRWDGKRPAIQFITKDFHIYLIQERANKIREKAKRNRKTPLVVKPYIQNDRYKWIENLLKTPIEDGRKQCLWIILCPYLVNVKKLTNQQASTVLLDWLKKCNDLRKLDFDSYLMIKSNLKNVKYYLPPLMDNLKIHNPSLYINLRNKKIILF